jgi:hypothetical protein
VINDAFDPGSNDDEKEGFVSLEVFCTFSGYSREQMGELLDRGAVTEHGCSKGLVFSKVEFAGHLKGGRHDAHR